MSVRATLAPDISERIGGTAADRIWLCQRLQRNSKLGARLLARPDFLGQNSFACREAQRFTLTLQIPLAIVTRMGRDDRLGACNTHKARAVGNGKNRLFFGVRSSFELGNLGFRRDCHQNRLIQIPNKRLQLQDRRNERQEKQTCN